MTDSMNYEFKPSPIWSARRAAPFRLKAGWYRWRTWWGVAPVKHYYVQNSHPSAAIQTAYRACDNQVMVSDHLTQEGPGFAPQCPACSKFAEAPLEVRRVGS